MPSLVAYYDLRPIDWETGKRVPATEDEMRLCDRCGTKHARVYVVRDDDGKEWSVGSGCVGRFFGGWKPGDAVVRGAKRVDSERAKAEAEERRIEEVSCVAEDVAERLASVPEPVLVDETEWRPGVVSQKWESGPVRFSHSMGRDRTLQDDLMWAWAEHEVRSDPRAAGWPFQSRREAVNMTMRILRDRNQLRESLRRRLLEQAEDEVRLLDTGVIDSGIDDLDEDFATPVVVELDIPRRLVARALGVQDRVLDRRLAKMRDVQLADALLGSDVVSGALKRFRRRIASAVDFWANDEFGHGASVVDVDIAENPNATVERGNGASVSITFDVDVLGRWTDESDPYMAGRVPRRDLF